MLETYIKEQLKERRILLMTHAVVGYPSLDDNWRMLECMQDAGVALVELQLPFSEPIADGPVFVKANQSALQHGLHWDEYFEFMARAAERFSFPLIFMGYYNSIFCMGDQPFCARLKQAGGQGYIIADLPPEQARELDGHARDQGLNPIHLMTPTNSDARLRQIAENAAGFVYCVARKGVTGSKTQLDQSTMDYIQRCRNATELPLALGFGIKSVQDIESLTGHIDIAIIGTAFLEMWEQQGENGCHDFLHSLYGSA